MAQMSDIVFIKFSQLPIECKRRLWKTNRRYLRVKMFIDPTFVLTKRMAKSCGFDSRKKLEKYL